MIITVLRNSDLFSFALPERASGQYQIYSNSGSLAGIINKNSGNWSLNLETGFSFVANPNCDGNVCMIEENACITVQENENGSYFYVMSEPSTKDSTTFSKYFLSQFGEFRIGRDVGMDVRFVSSLISPHHATIYYDNNGTWIEDTGTPNGTFVNGERINKRTKLNNGDMIYIVGLKLILAGQILAINKPSGKLIISSRLSQVILKKAENAVSTDHSESQKTQKFSRSPRFINHIEPLTLKISAPPAPVELQTMPMIYVLGPSVTMGAASLTTAILMPTIPTLVMSFSMLTMTVLWPTLTKRFEKKKRIAAEQERVEKYTEYLAEKRQLIQNTIKHQEDMLREAYPPADEIAQRVFELNRRLWERSPWHDDYLTVRLGLGQRKLIGEISCPEKQFKVSSDHLEEDMYQLAGQPYTLEQVPITVQLNEVITGIIGEKAQIRNIMKLIISQLITLHSYDECKIFAAFSHKEQAHWSFLYDVPHCWDNDFNNRNIVTNSSELNTCMSTLGTIFEERKAQVEAGINPEFNVRYVVLLMDRELVATNATIRSILDYKTYLGISVIAAFDDLMYLPTNCTQIIEVAQNEGRIYHRFTEDTSIVEFVPDVSQTDFNAMVNVMANIASDSIKKQAGLPNLITFMEMMKVGCVDQLNSATRWKEHNATQSIEAELGVDEQNKPFILNLHEKSHGPHGLIAGMTGSGKSELIMTMILSLAINYHPYDVAFILIDFKGGGMAKAFEKLPHTVGIITNLDGNEIKRSLASINSELRKRQILFAEAAQAVGESNIDIYKYQQLYRAGVVKHPLPHLFIVSDEFAELKNQYPDFMSQLVSAARIGRSLGVHLILATQKPSGVVDDQIWSNSKFRICLKVQDKSDSQDVIKRPDAAELSTTGRFYLQVGYNELFETGQSAWSGAPYFPSNTVQKKIDENVIVVDHLGHQIMSVAPKRTFDRQKTSGKQLDAIVQYLAALADNEGIYLPPMWAEPLPEVLNLADIAAPVAEDHSISAVCGLVDDPENQAQWPLVVDLAKNGNVLLYGLSGSGRTTFLCTLIYQLLTKYSPDELHLHLVDCGTGSLNVFSKAPHIGYSLSTSDATEIDSLFKTLRKEIATRKSIFSKIGGEFSAYFASGKRDIPCLVVVINNYASFYEVYNEQEDDLAFLSREGAKYGVYFVMTTSGGGSVRNRVAQNFTQVFALQQNDTVDYSAILGSTKGVYPKELPGRGIFKSEQQTYEFQTAFIYDTDDYNRFNFFSETANYLLEQNGGVKADGLNGKMFDLSYSTYLSELQLSGAERKLPVGVTQDTDDVLYLNFDTHALVPILSQSTQHIGFVRQLLRLLAEGCVEAYVFDPQDELSLASKNNLVYINDACEVNNQLSELIDLIVNRFKQKKNGIVQSEFEFSPLIIYFQNYSSVDELLNDELRPRLYDLLENATELGVMILFGGTPSSINPFSIKKWYRKRIKGMSGMWIGPGYDSQNIFTLAHPFSAADLKDDSCYVLNNGILQTGRRLRDDADEYGRTQHE